MTNFNLLPSEYQKKNFPLRRILLFISLALLLIVLIKLSFIEPVQRKKQTLQQLALIKEKTGGYSDLGEEQLQQLSDMEELEQRILAFQEMEEGTPRYWKNVLDTLIKTLPQNSTLNHFTCDSNALILAGVCRDDRTSAAYLLNLKDSGCFSQVYMEKIVYQQEGEVHFTIRCILHLDTTGGMIP